MMEPFKNLFNRTTIGKIADEISSVMQNFNKKKYLSSVFDSEWEYRELKDRMRHAANCLVTALPLDFSEASSLLMKASKDQKGFHYLILTEYIAIAGIEHFAPAVKALAELTKCSSSEFAVRPFLIRYGQKMIDQMLKWSSSKNTDIRRLSSEGCRPILPWGMDIPALRKDPSPIFPILENLKADESLYVRKSVANNLNAISKDHPEAALQIAKSWYGTDPNTDWIVKHALRTLLKKGHSNALQIFAYAKPDSLQLRGLELTLKKKPENIAYCEFSLSGKKPLGKLRIEYKLVMPRLRGKTGSKVFMISDRDVLEKNTDVRFKHSFKKITTRVYYSGEYLIEILVNGQCLGETRFQLKFD